MWLTRLVPCDFAKSAALLRRGDRLFWVSFGSLSYPHGRASGWDPKTVGKWLERQAALTEGVAETLRRHEFNGEQLLALSEDDLLRAGVPPVFKGRGCHFH